MISQQKIQNQSKNYISKLKNKSLITIRDIPSKFKPTRFHCTRTRICAVLHERIGYTRACIGHAVRAVCERTLHRKKVRMRFAVCTKLNVTRCVRLAFFSFRSFDFSRARSFLVFRFSSFRESDVPDFTSRHVPGDDSRIGENANPFEIFRYETWSCAG